MKLRFICGKKKILDFLINFDVEARFLSILTLQDNIYNTFIKLKFSYSKTFFLG